MKKINRNQIPIFTKDKKVSLELMDILESKQNFTIYKNLEAYFNHNKLDYNKNDLKLLNKQFHNIILSSFQQFSFLIYKSFLLSNDWGSLGKEQITYAYAKSLLDLDDD